MSPMSATVRGIFYLIAVVLFVVGTIAPAQRVNMVAAGLGFFAFVPMWDTFAVA